MPTINLTVQDSDENPIDIDFYVSSQDTRFDRFRTDHGKISQSFPDKKLLLLGLPAFVEQDSKLLVIDAPTAFLVRSDIDLKISYRPDSIILNYISDTVSRLTEVELQSLDGRLSTLEDADLDSRVSAIEGQQCGQRLFELESLNLLSLVQRFQNLEEASLIERVQVLEDSLQTKLNEILSGFRSVSAIEVVHR